MPSTTRLTCCSAPFSAAPARHWSLSRAVTVQHVRQECSHTWQAGPARPDQLHGGLLRVVSPAGALDGPIHRGEHLCEALLPGRGAVCAVAHLGAALRPPAGLRWSAFKGRLRLQGTMRVCF